MEEAAPALSRRPAQPLGLFAAVVTFLLGVAFSPVVTPASWTPRAALLLVIAAVGLPFLVALLATSARRAAVMALAFVAVAAVSTALSPQPQLSVLGLYGWGTGLIFVLAVTGAWAIGQALTETERRRVEWALVAAVAVNAALGLAQIAVDLGVDELRLIDDRAAGFMGNPVHLGSLMVAGVGVAVWRRGRQWTWLALLVLAAAAIQVSGTRLAVLSATAIVVAAAVRVPWRQRALLLGALAIGIGLGSAVAEVGGGLTGTQRTLVTVEGEGSSGITARTETWWSARHAVADRPLLGVGPGLFRVGTSKYRTLELARTHSPETLFTDAHNLVVEYAVTTGLVGLAVLAAWLALAGRSARGPLAAAAAGLLLMHLGQPQALHVTPLAALLVGAAAPRLANGGSMPRWLRLPVVGLTLPALAAAGALLYGTFWMDQAVLDFDLSDARVADRALPGWPQPAELRGRILAFKWITEDERTLLVESRDWHEEAVRRDPSSPQYLNRLGEIELQLGLTDLAQQRFLSALEYNPWSATAMVGLANVEFSRGDNEAAQRWLGQARLLGVDPRERSTASDDP